MMRYMVRNLLWRLWWLVVISCSLLAACGVNASGDTSQAGGRKSGAHIFVNSLYTTARSASVYMTTLNSGDGKIDWQQQEQWIAPGFHVIGAPVSADGVLYALSDSYPPNTTPTGFLTAFRSSDGQRLWQVKVGAMGSSPVVRNGRVYLSAIEYATKSNKKWIYALDAQSGKQMWRTELIGGAGVNDTLTFANGNLYISSNQLCLDMCNATYIFALNATTGALRWHKSFQATASSRITVNGASAYVYIVDGSASTPGQGLYAFNADTGETRWFVADAIPLIGSYYGNAEGVGGAAIEITSGVIYAKRSGSADQAGNTNYTLTALDAASGHALWSIATTEDGTILAIDAHTVYVQTGKAHGDVTPDKTKKTSASPYTYFLTAISMHNGQSLWQQQLVNRFTQSEVVDGTIYGAGSDSSLTKTAPLVAINTANGDTIWQASIASAASIGPNAVFTVAQDVLYASFNTDTLTVVSLKDGKILWERKIPGSVIVSVSVSKQA